jgi:DNA-binding transcriptional MerR regulator
MTEALQIKSDEAYKTISEAAESLGLTISTIRFWEKEFKQLKPSLINKRRHYSKENLEIIKKIKSLLHEEGYTLIGAKKYFNNAKLAGATSENAIDLKSKITSLISLLQLAKKELEIPDID